MKRFLFLIIPVTLVAAVYIAYPYWTLHRFETALSKRDSATLETLVDFEQVRNGLKADFRSYMAETMNQPKSPTGGMEDIGIVIGMTLGGIVESLIDQTVSANGLLLVWQQQLAANSERKLADFVASARFQSLTTFRVDMRNPDDPQSATLTLLLEFVGVEWRVTKVILPPNAFQAATTQAKSDMW